MSPSHLFEKLLFGVRFVLVSVYFFLACFPLCLYATLRPFHISSGYLFCRLVSPVVLKILGVKVRFLNPEEKLAHQPCVYISNHQHLLDLFTFSYTLPTRTLTLGKKSIRWIPIFGWLYWFGGHLLIDRKNNERAVATMKEAAERLRESRFSLFVFPEGTRSRGKGLGPFKKGAFRLAVDTGFPIVPIVASTYFGKLQLGRWNAGTVVMKVFPPIPSQGRDADALLEESRRQMVAAIEELDRLEANERSTLG